MERNSNIPKSSFKIIVSLLIPGGHQATSSFVNFVNIFVERRVISTMKKKQNIGVVVQIPLQRDIM